MEHLLRSEKCLQVCDKEKYSGVEQCWKLVVQFRVEKFVSALGFFESLTSLRQFYVVLAFRSVSLNILEGMALTVVIN